MNLRYMVVHFLSLVLCLANQTANAYSCDKLIRNILVYPESYTIHGETRYVARSPFMLGGSYTYVSNSSRDIDHIEKLRFANYNVQDFIYSSTAHIVQKSEIAQAGLAIAINDIEPDVMAIEEISSLEMLTDFAKVYLGGRYEAMLLNGNTDRSINIGFLIKKDLPFKFELHSFKDLKTEYFHQKIDSFSRDFPVLVMKRLDNDRPVMAVGAVHSKSQGYDLPIDPKNIIRRKGQMRDYLHIVKMVREKYDKNLPFIMAGDFNTDLHSGELSEIYKEGFKDPFDSVYSENAIERVTHTYHNREVTSYSQLDGLLYSYPDAPYPPLYDVGTYRYRYPNGEVIPLPKTFGARSKNPSDHYPIYADYMVPRV